MNEGHLIRAAYTLKAPATTAIEFLELVQSPEIGELNDKQKEYLEQAITFSRMMLSLVDYLLDLEKRAMH